VMPTRTIFDCGYVSFATSLVVYLHRTILGQRAVRAVIWF
jgi:hypothetical protein